MKLVITPLDTPPTFPAAVVTGITALPGGQGGAVGLTGPRNIVTAGGTGCGVQLQAVLGGYQWVFNATSQALLVFPLVGTLIFGSALNVAVSIPPGGAASFTFDNVSVWYQGSGAA